MITHRESRLSDRNPLSRHRLKTASLASIAVVIAGAAVVPRFVEAQTFHVVESNIGGDGGTDYLTAEPGTGRVFVSRGTHVMVVDGPTGKVLGDISDTPRTHGIALAAKFGRPQVGRVSTQDQDRRGWARRNHVR